MPIDVPEVALAQKRFTITHTGNGTTPTPSFLVTVEIPALEINVAIFEREAANGSIDEALQQKTMRAISSYVGSEIIRARDYLSRIPEIVTDASTGGIDNKTNGKT